VFIPVARKFITATAPVWKLFGSVFEAVLFSYQHE